MNNTLSNTRIIICSKTSAEWGTNTTVILKGELAIELTGSTPKIKIGNGVDVFKDLPYLTDTPEEITSLINSTVAKTAHTHDNKSILDSITAAFTTELLNKLNGIEAGANKTITDSAMSSTSTNPVQNKVVKAELDKKVPTTRTVNGKALSSDVTLSATDVGAIPSTQKGTSGGVAELDSTGKVPASQLPSFVDDVVEGYYYNSKFYKDSTHGSEITGEKDKIYVDLDSNKTYRYSGSTYVEISQSLALGETSSTAYRGDRGKIAYDHSQSAHAPSNAERNAIVGIQKNGTDLTVDANRKVNISVPTKTSEITNDSGYLTSSGIIEKANQLTNTRKIDGVAFNGTADIVHYAECSTAASTVAKTVSLTGFNLVTGARIAIKFTVTNTASSPTLNVGGTGAKSIVYRGSAVSAGVLASNRVYEFIYDGTNWVLIGDLDTNTTYSAGAGLTLSGTQFKHSNSVTAGTAKGDDTKTLAFGGTFTIPTVTYDGQGHITSKGTTTMTMPAKPTDITGNAGTADKWKTARNFSIGGAITASAVPVDGSKDIILNATAVNANALFVADSDVLILNGNF